MARDLEIEAYCFYQMPDSITIGPQGPTKTEQLRLRTPEPGHLIECWAGIDSKSKTAALTKKCCPGGYYDEQKEVSINLEEAHQTFLSGWLRVRIHNSNRNNSQ